MVGGSSRVFRQLLVVVVSIVVGDRRQVVDGYQCYQYYVSCQCYFLGGSIFVVSIAISFAIGSDSHQSGQCCSRFGPSVFYTLVAPMLVEQNAPAPSSANDADQLRETNAKLWSQPQEVTRCWKLPKDFVEMATSHNFFICPAYD